MIAPSHNRQHRSAQRRVGETRGAKHAAHTSAVAFKDAQDWSAATCDGAGLFDSLPHYRLGGLASLPSHLIPVTLRSLPVERLRRADSILPIGRPATPNFCGAYSGVRTLLNIGHHVRQDKFDVPKTHVLVAFPESRSNDRDPSERQNGRVPNSKANLPNSRGEFPNVA